MLALYIQSLYVCLSLESAAIISEQSASGESENIYKIMYIKVINIVLNFFNLFLNVYKNAFKII